jgi:hypothetical protein
VPQWLHQFFKESEMVGMKELILCVVAFLFLFGMLFFAGIYNDTLRMECREKAIEKGVYSSAEIQVICK